MIENSFRELTPGEKREYQDWIRLAKEQASRMRAFDKVAMWSFVTVPLIVGVWVALESKGPAFRQVVMGGLGLILAEIALVVFFWDVVMKKVFKREEKRAYSIEDLEKVLAANRVEVLRVQASAVVDFEEIGDLGPYYAFQIGEDDILCVGGQNYFDLKKFPNDDFEIVKHALLEDEIHSLGNKLKPLRTIPAETYRAWDAPFNEDRFAGKLADLEKILPTREDKRP